MAEIKYKAKQNKQLKISEKIIQSEVEEFKKTVKSNRSDEIQSHHLPSSDFANQRQPEVMIWNNNSTELKLSSKFIVEPLRISRAQSFRQTVKKDKDSIPAIRQFSTRKNVSPKKIGILDLLKKDIPLSDGKITNAKNKTTQHYLIQKIINFRTKVMKISSKNINQQIQRKSPGESMGVPQRLNNLYNIVVRNIQDDYDQVVEFANIKSLISQAKVTRKKEKSIQNIERYQQSSQLNCRYSSERIYKQIRKQYHPIEKADLRQYQSAKKSSILRKNIDKSLFKEGPSLHFTKTSKINKKKSIKQDKLQGW